MPSASPDPPVLRPAAPGDAPAIAEICWLAAGPFNYAAAADNGPITVPCHRYVKDV